MATIKKRWTKTPALKPGTYTADQVLDKVARLIETEPRRLQMQTWVAMWKGKVLWRIERMRKPACGTVACLGGWINIVTHNMEEYESGNVGGFSGGLALDALGLNINDDAGRDLYQLFGETSLKSQEVLRRLAQFRHDYSEELQTAKVVVK